MTRRIWNYNGEVERTAPTGSLWIQITPAKQQRIEIYLLRVKNDTAARNLRIHQVWSGDWIFYFSGTLQEFVFPSDDFVGTFKCAKPGRINLMTGDYLTIENTNAEQNDKLEFTIRAELNTYAKPTVNIDLGMAWVRDESTIKGVIK